MQKIFLAFLIVFEIVINNHGFGQHTWIARQTEEEDGSFFLHISFKKKIVTDYELIKNSDGISYILKINTKNTLLDLMILNPDNIFKPRVATSEEREGIMRNEEIRKYLGLKDKHEIYRFTRVQVRDDDPNYLNWYPHNIGGTTYETGPCRYFEICRIEGSNDKILIRWIKSPIYFNGTTFVMELLFLNNDVGGTDDIHNLVYRAALFTKKNN